MYELTLGLTLQEMVDLMLFYRKHDLISPEVQLAVNQMTRPVYAKVGGPGTVVTSHWKASTLA